MKMDKLARMLVVLFGALSFASSCHSAAAEPTFTLTVTP